MKRKNSVKVIEDDLLPDYDLSKMRLVKRGAGYAQRTKVPPQPQPRNEAMFAVLQRSAERMKDVSVTGSTEGTLKQIREARAGAMWGYEPTDAND